VRFASVVSKAKSSRAAASACIRASMIRPAEIATDSGRKADSPAAIASALTNSSTASASLNKSGAAVDLPAPFGPATTMTWGLADAALTMLPTNLALFGPSSQSISVSRSSRFVAFLKRAGLSPRAIDLKCSAPQLILPASVLRRASLKRVPLVSTTK